MAAKLLVDSPQRSCAYTLPLDQNRKYIIGTRSGSDVPLPPGSGSAEHAFVIYDKGRWVLIDNDSQQGTFISGDRVVEVPLNHNDTVRIGQCEIIYQNPADAGSDSVLIRMQDMIAERQRQLSNALASNDPSVINLSELLDSDIRAGGDASSTGPSSLNVASLPPDAPPLEESELVRVAKSVTAILDECLAQKTRDDIFALMVRRLREAIDADNGFIMLPNPKTGRWMIRAWVGDPSSWTQFGRTQPVPLSVTNRAFESMKVVSNALDGAEPENSSSPSMLELEVNSYIAVPLVRAGRPGGVLYFDTRNPAKEFNSSDVKLIDRIGGYVLEIEDQYAAA